MATRQNEINYYEILSQLREYEYKLLKINNATPVWDIDVLLLKIKAFIFKYDVLKNEFKRRQDAFYKTTKTKLYKNRYQEIYEKIKVIAIERAKKENRELTYLLPHQAKEYYGLFNAKVTNSNNESRILADQPNEYFYPSLQADTVELTGIFPCERDRKKLKVSRCLNSFYYDIEENLSTIKVPKHYEQPYKAKGHDDDEDEVIFGVPYGIEYFIASGDINCDCGCDGFRLFFYATSVCCVLIELQGYIQMLIETKEYSNIPDSLKEKAKLTYNADTKSFYLNNQLLNLTEAEIETMQETMKPENEKRDCDKRKHASRVTSINRKMREQSGIKCNFIISRRSKFYKFDEKILKVF